MMSVSGILNFLPWLDQPRLANLPIVGWLFDSPRKWIVEGQRFAHREYARVTDSIREDAKSGNDDESPNMTESYLQLRTELRDKQAENQSLFKCENDQCISFLYFYKQVQSFKLNLVTNSCTFCKRTFSALASTPPPSPSGGASSTSANIQSFK